MGERSDAVLRTAIGERSDAVLRTAIGERSDAVLRTAIGERSDAVLRTAMPGDDADGLVTLAVGVIPTFVAIDLSPRHGRACHGHPRL